MSNKPVETILITEEKLLPIVEKYFDQISSSQWALLAAGEIDLGTHSVITEMLTEIVQTASMDILNIIMPRIHEHMSRTGNLPLDMTVKPELRDSFPRAFSQVLDIPPQGTYAGFKELTQLTEEEIEHKVKSAMTSLSESSDLPAKPAIFVSSSMSTPQRFFQMVSHTISCLTHCVSKFVSRCCSPSSKPVDSKTSRGSESDTEITKQVVDVLMKWTDEGERVPVSELPPHALAQKTAAGIMQVIKVETEFEDRSDQSCLGLRQKLREMKTMTKVRKFVCSHLDKQQGDKDKEKERSCFSEFVKKHTEKWLDCLRSSKHQQAEQFVVDVKPPSRQRGSQEDFVLPGCVPEPVPTPLKSRESKTVFLEKQDSFAEINEKIKKHLEIILTKVHSEERPSNPEELLEKLMGSVEVKSLAAELTERVYGQFIQSCSYKLPMSPRGRSCCGMILSRFKKKVDDSQAEYSPEVLYAFTEDVITNFLQRMLLWIVTHLSDEATYCEKVSAALQDIERIFKESASHSASRVPSSGVSPVAAAEPGSSAASAVSSARDFCISREDDLVLALLLNLLSRYKDRCTKEAEVAEITAVIERLSNLAVTSDEGTLKELKKVVLEQLWESHGTLDGLLRAAMDSRNKPFDRNVINALKKVLGMEIPAPKGAFAKCMAYLASLFKCGKSSERENGDEEKV